MASEAHLPVVTIASLYGAAGSEIGSRVAEALGVPFVSRPVVDQRVEDAGFAGVCDDRPRTPIQRAVAALGRASTLTGGGGASERLDVDQGTLRSYIEETFARVANEGGVAMGRGGMIVLRTVPWALHVHLGGPDDGRAARRMERDGIDKATAQVRLRNEDRARMAYVRRTYGIEGSHPWLYHLMIDTIALGIDTSADLIVTAARRRAADPIPTPPI